MITHNKVYKKHICIPLSSFTVTLMRCSLFLTCTEGFDGGGKRWKLLPGGAPCGWEGGGPCQNGCLGGPVIPGASGLYGSKWSLKKYVRTCQLYGIGISLTMHNFPSFAILELIFIEIVCLLTRIQCSLCWSGDR